MYYYPLTSPVSALPSRKTSCALLGGVGGWSLKTGRRNIAEIDLSLYQVHFRPKMFDCKLLFMLSTSIYDLVLIYVCHFHHHHPLKVSQILPLLRYSCCYLGSLHPRNFMQKIFVHFKYHM